MLQINKIYLGDCLEVMKQISDKSVDMILCDLPYGTTNNKWDSVLKLDILWEHYNRIIKDNGAIVLTTQSPFDKILGYYNIKNLKTEWIWEKEAGTGFLNAKKYPLKSHENILVFCNGVPKYNPQMENGKSYLIKKGGGTTNYRDDSKKNIITENNGVRYPKTVIKFNRDKSRLHPTQKPIKLYEYLIKTYSNEGDLILDNCIGSGTTAIAAINTNRNFIGIESYEKFFSIAQQCIEMQIKKIKLYNKYLNALK